MLTVLLVLALAFRDHRSGWQLCRLLQFAVAVAYCGRPVGRQTGLSLPERRRNVRGAFVAIGPVPASVVLVDDVYTTGATVAAAATALRAGGATRVNVVTFARAVR